MRSERTEFPGAQGQRLAARLDTPDAEVRALRAVRPLLHLRQGHLRRKPHRADADRARHRRAALRLHGPGRQRRRVRQHELLLEHRRPRCGGGPHARDLAGAAPLDRPQPRRRRRAGRGVRHLPEVRAVVTIGAPSDPAHVDGLVREQPGRDRGRGARPKCSWPGGPSGSSASS